MPQTEEQRIRSRLRSYERKLQKEKKQYGFYRDGAGKRYQVGPHYMLLDDNDGALAAFQWFEKEFPDEVGKPDFFLCWSLALSSRSQSAFPAPLTLNLGSSPIFWVRRTECYE